MSHIFRHIYFGGLCWGFSLPLFQDFHFIISWKKTVVARKYYIEGPSYKKLQTHIHRSINASISIVIPESPEIHLLSLINLADCRKLQSYERKVKGK